MTKPEDYTVKQFEDEIKAIIKAYPDNVNPTNGGIGNICVYRTSDGRNCVIGKWLHEHHPKTLNSMTVDSRGNTIGVDGYSSAILAFLSLDFSIEVAGTAQRIQDQADFMIAWKDIEV